MEYETACDQIRDNIVSLLIALEPPTPRATFAAARATREIAEALHHAAGAPDDDRWYDALASLETFVNICDAGLRPVQSPALAELREFLDENADLVRVVHKKAS